MMGNPKKRVVIFGGAGFIGSELSAYLAVENLVIALGRVAPGFLPDGVQFQSISFEEPETWKDLIHPEDFICFLIPFNLSKKQIESDLESKHMQAFQTLLEECDEKKISNFLFLSSGGSIYGNSAKKHSENDVTAPVSPYGIFKLKQENLLKAFSISKNLPLVIARPSNVYGENQDPGRMLGAVTVFYHKIANNIPIDLYGDLSISKDYIHVLDLVSALGTLCIHKKQGIYNLGFGKSYTLKEIIDQIENILRTKAQINIHPFANSDIHSYSLDCNKAQNEINFKPKIDLYEGITRYNQKGKS